MQRVFDSTRSLFLTTPSIKKGAEFATATAAATATTATTTQPIRVAVFGGTGYVGARVCERLVHKGYAVTAISRRGVNPKPDNEFFNQVKWVAGDATDPELVQDIVKDSDAAVHAIGVLFDTESGLSKYNQYMSGSGTLPGKADTYDTITRQTMFHLIDAIQAKTTSTTTTDKNTAFPLCFVSAAEAGWPDVAFGSTIETHIAPSFLKKYLQAKRTVEERLLSPDSQTNNIRSIIYRPAVIWDWSKVGLVPVVSAINVANAIGIPFVFKACHVETLADAIIAGIEDPSVSGIQRSMQIEELAKQK